MNLFRHLRLPQDPFWRNCERKFEFSELSSLRVFPRAEFSSAEAKKTSWRTPQKQAWYEYRRIHICRGNSESCPNRIKELETCSRDWSDRNYNEGPHLKENRLIRLKNDEFMRADRPRSQKISRFFRERKRDRIQVLVDRKRQKQNGATATTWRIILKRDMHTTEERPKNRHEYSRHKQH